MDMLRRLINCRIFIIIIIINQHLGLSSNKFFNHASGKINYLIILNYVIAVLA